MASIVEMARAEADQVEAEEETLADEDTSEEEAEVETSPADDPPEAVAGVDPKELERESARHEKALRKIFGPVADGMDACGQCGGVGFVPPDFAPAVEIQRSPDTVTCDACKGIGIRLTGSLNPQYETEPCSVCTGTGYRDRGQIEAMRAAQAYQTPPPVTSTPPAPRWNAAQNQWEDEYGRPLSGSSSAPTAN